MTNELSASARKVQKALQAAGLQLEVIELPGSTRTAPEAAQAVGCQVGQIVKSLIFRLANTNRPVLIIASGANRVNEKAIGSLLDEPIVRADPDFAQEHTGYAIGGIPPIAHLHPIQTLIDQDLLKHEEIWAAAGTPHAVFRLTPADLLEMTGGQVVNICGK